MIRMRGQAAMGGRPWCHGVARAWLFVVLALWLGGCDAVMMSDNRHVTWTGTEWTMSAAGATANVVQASDATLSGFARVPDSATTLVFQDQTWISNEGYPSLVLKSSLQEVTATYASGRYTLSGLVAGPAFQDVDTLTVEVPGVSGAPTPVIVDVPPPITDPNALLGPPMGGQTQVSIPDGWFDHMYVYVTASGSAGDSGLSRLVPAASMPVDGNGMRTAPLLEPAALDELARRGLTPTTVYLAYYNTVQTGVLFPGTRRVPVQAGRMFQIAASDLGL